jgi:hypothetical protein
MEQRARRQSIVKATVAIVSAWLLVRVAMSFFVHPMMVGDQVAYLEAAHDFVASNGSVLARRSPSYVAFLAAISWVGPIGIYALQSLMTLGAALLTQRRLGFWQAFGIAACPFFVIWEWALLTETLCLTALWLGWLLIFWPHRSADVVIGGIFLALAVLARPLLLLLPLVPAAILYSRSNKRLALAMLAAAYLPVAAVAPLVSGPDFFGENLWIGSWEHNSDWMTNGWTWPAEVGLGPEQRRALLAAHSAQKSGPFLDAAIDRYRAAPLQSVASWFVRYPYLWIGTRTAFSTLPIGSAAWLAYKSIMWLLNAAIMLSGAIGGRAALRRPVREATLVAPVAYVALIYLPFHDAEPRYSVVVLPFLIVLGLFWLGERQAASRSFSSTS